LGALKAKLAKYRNQLIEDASAKGPKGEGFEVQKHGDARVAMIGFPSVGKVGCWLLLLHRPFPSCHFASPRTAPL
jgi:ribosome-interacting GTPase 1